MAAVLRVTKTSRRPILGLGKKPGKEATFKLCVKRGEPGLGSRPYRVLKRWMSILDVPRAGKEY